MVHIIKPCFTSFNSMCFPVGEAERDRQIYLWWKRRNGNCVFWVMCTALAACHFPLGRGPLLSSNLCLLLIHSPLGTLMWGVWRKPFPQPCAGLKRTQLPWCALCFGPDSTVATEGRFPLGAWALEAHLSEDSDGWDGICCCGSHGKHVNESTKCTSNSHLQDWVWCETRHD